MTCLISRISFINDTLCIYKRNTTYLTFHRVGREQSRRLILKKTGTRKRASCSGIGDARTSPRANYAKNIYKSNSIVEITANRHSNRSMTMKVANRVTASALLPMSVPLADRNTRWNCLKLTKNKNEEAEEKIMTTYLQRLFREVVTLSINLGTTVHRNPRSVTPTPFRDLLDRRVITSLPPLCLTVPTLSQCNGPCLLHDLLRLNKINTITAHDKLQQSLRITMGSADALYWGFDVSTESQNAFAEFITSNCPSATSNWSVSNKSSNVELQTIGLGISSSIFGYAGVLIKY